MDNNEEIKLPDHTHPSDYSDVHPRTYDPEFISQISSKMQVPHRIGVGNELNDYDKEFINQELQAATHFVGMTVPDKIVLAGDNNHLAMKQDLTLELPGASFAFSKSLSYVGLITPPRILTLEERFPVVEETDQKLMIAHGSVGFSANNGHISGFTIPYDPGVNPQDSVTLHNDDSALLRAQVSKLTRRVQMIELDNQKRANREFILYPLIMSYLIWKFIGWLSRDR